MIVICYLLRSLIMSILWWWCNQNLLFDSLIRKVNSMNIHSSNGIARICCFINNKAIGTTIGKFTGISSKVSFEKQDQKIRMSWFIQVSSHIAALFTSMLMTIRSTEFIAKVGESKVGVANSKYWWQWDW